MPRSIVSDDDFSWSHVNNHFYRILSRILALIISGQRLPLRKWHVYEEYATRLGLNNISCVLWMGNFSFVPLITLPIIMIRISYGNVYCCRNIRQMMTRKLSCWWNLLGRKYCAVQEQRYQSNKQVNFILAWVCFSISIFISVYARILRSRVGARGDWKCEIPSLLIIGMAGTRAADPF